MAPPPSPSLPPPSPSDDALRLPSLDALRAFEAAARLGSYERAAEALHITASAVGKRVATLEEQLGLTLFQRGSKPLQLSASGREYLAAIWPALEQLARVPQHQRGAQRGQRLRLSAPPTLAREVLVPALPAFAEQHPDIELELVLSVPFLDQGGSDADLDVRHGQALRTDDRPLMQDVLIPLASPALLPDGPLRQRRPGPPAPAAQPAGALDPLVPRGGAGLARARTGSPAVRPGHAAGGRPVRPGRGAVAPAWPAPPCGPAGCARCWAPGPRPG
jgi:DNA-binding transcriptional LysR family regulator